MTRFARSKGSKGSNARVPESGTSWEIMKKQLEISQLESKDASARKKAEEQRLQNYQNFLKEEKKKNSKRSWCDFTDQNESNVLIINKKKLKRTEVARVEIGGSPEKNVENITKYSKNDNSNFRDIVQTSKIMKTSAGLEKPKGKIKKSKVIKGQLLNSGKIIEKDNEDSNLKNDSLGRYKLKKKKGGKRMVSLKSNKISKTNLDDNENDGITSTTYEQGYSETKLNKKIKLTGNDNTSDTEKVGDAEIHLEATNKTSHGKVKNNLRKILKKTKIKKGASFNLLSENTETANGIDKKNKRDNEPRRKKSLEDRGFKLVVGGEELQLARFDGFPILAKDAKRLEKLQQAMKSKGIPKSEIFQTIRLERRRAEKNLARLKKFVCYNCRMAGHLLSECPEISNAGSSMPTTGLCFKCGSTEHKSYECKVQKGDVFRFSKCFVCKEQGHIARQCPDHPKGLYPKGGACKLCGDVTHFKKDCPTMLDKVEDDKITLETLKHSDNLEELEPKVETVVKKQKKAKLVKF